MMQEKKTSHSWKSLVSLLGAAMRQTGLQDKYLNSVFEVLLIEIIYKLDGGSKRGWFEQS